MADPTGDPVGGLSAVIAAVVPILLGGVTTYFKIFVTPKDDFRNRTKLKRANLKENLAGKLTLLLQHVRSLTADDDLRGDGRENPDYITQYTEETFRVFTIHGRLGLLDRILKYAYLLLYITIVAGLAGAIVAWRLPVASGCVFWTAIGLIGVQVLTIFAVQWASCKLDEYEDVT